MCPSKEIMMNSRIFCFANKTLLSLSIHLLFLHRIKRTSNIPTRTSLTQRPFYHRKKVDIDSSPNKLLSKLLGSGDVIAIRTHSNFSGDGLSAII